MEQETLKPTSLHLIAQQLERIADALEESNQLAKEDIL